MKAVLLLLALVSVSMAVPWGKQYARVKGRLLCGNNKPLKNVKVRLVDYDAGPSPDDELDEGTTDNDGRFDLSGSVWELGRIDPVIRVYHDCEDGIKPCQRQWERYIPKKYIDNRKGADIGTINLELEDSSEERKCFHL